MTAPEGDISMRTLHQTVLVLSLCAAALAGCATGASLQGANLAPGMPRDAVIARYGQPTRAVSLPAGERLQYSLQPAGQYAYMVDLDGAGRVASVSQALTANNFARIDIGRWTRADVEREFGPPARIEHTGDWKDDILTYRWKDGANADMFYWVYVDAKQVVGRTQQGPEYYDLDDRVP